MSALCLGPCRPPEHGGPRQAGKGGRLCDVCRERLWEHLHAIADAWPDLIARLATEGSTAMSERVSGSSTPGLVINERVSGVMHDVTAWLAFVVRMVLDEREVTAPVDQSPAGMARWLASRHTDWLATHHDEQLVEAIAGEAFEHARACRRAAYPSGARLLELPELACTEHSTDEEGARVPCAGHMTAWVQPQATHLPDLVCSLDRDHRIDPATWQRAGWKRAALHSDAALALSRAISGGSGSV